MKMTRVAGLLARRLFASSRPLILAVDGNESLAATYFGGAGQERQEPFAMLHRL